MLAHHATLIHVSSLKQLPPLVEELRASCEIELIETNRLSIAQVREVIVSAHQRPFAMSTKVIVIAAQVIAPEAQQALLKVLEEPPATTQFLLIMERSSGLLPTVHSRLSVLAHDTLSVPTSSHFDTFLQQSIPERLTYITNTFKNKDEVESVELYAGLSAWLMRPYQDLSATTRGEIVALYQFLGGPGASKKMLWEGLAFLLPVE